MSDSKTDMEIIGNNIKSQLCVDCYNIIIHHASSYVATCYNIGKSNDIYNCYSRRHTYTISL